MASKLNFIIASANSFFIVAVLALRSTHHLEERLIAENDLFASGMRWVSAPSRGVVTLLGVPVFSSEFDLGTRVPQSQSWGFSGLVLLRHFVPQSMIVVTCVGALIWIFSRTMLALFQSFGVLRRYAVASLMLYNAALLWPITRYDWSSVLVSVLAVSLLVLMIIRAELWLNHGGRQSQLVGPIDYCGLIGFSIAASISHYGMLSVAIPVVILAATVRTRRYYPVVSKHKGKLIVCLLPCIISFSSFLIQYRELSDYVSNRRSVFSSFPPLTVSNAKHLVGQILQGELSFVGSLVPGLSFARFGVQYSAYSGLFPIAVTAVATFVAVKIAPVDNCKSRFNLLSFYVVALLVSLFLLFGWPIKLSIVQQLPSSVDFWLLIPATIGSVISPLVVGLVHRDSQKRPTSIKLLLGCATCSLLAVGLLHSWNAVMPWSRTPPTSLVAMVRQSRDVVLEASSFNQATGYRLLNLSGSGFAIGPFRDAGVVVVGLPTKLRAENLLLSSSKALSDMNELTNLRECPLDVVDFLGAKVVIAGSQLADQCRGNSHIQLSRSVGQPIVLSVDRFHSWWTDDSDSTSCQLLDSGCLVARSLRRGAEAQEVPFLSFSDENAGRFLASVKVPSERAGDYLVLPLSASHDWDVIDQRTGSRVQSIDVAGLLGVPAGQLGEVQSSELGIRYRPSFMDWVISLTAWVWILAVVFALWFLRRGVSVRDGIRD